MNSKLERTLATIIFGSFFWLLFNFFTVSFYSSVTDSAGFVDVLNNIHMGKGMTSSAFSSIYSLIPYLTYDLDQYLVSDFQSLYHAQDFSAWHSYTIAYPLSLLQYLGISSLHLAALMMSVAVAGTALLSYVFLRQNDVCIAYSCFFVTSIMFFLPFTGHIFGAFYFDRLFVFFELLLLALLYSYFERNVDNFKSIAFIFLIVIMISERAAMFAVLSLAYFMVINFSQKKKNLRLASLIILATSYLIIYMIFYQDSLYYAGVTLLDMRHHLGNSFNFNQDLGRKTLILFSFMAPLIFTSLWSKKYFILGVAPIFSNLIISVGGAEKVGFTTHYHSLYFPFILFSTLLGFISLTKTKMGEVGRFFVAASIPVLIISTYRIAFHTPYISPFNVAAIMPWGDSVALLNQKKRFFESLVSSVPTDVRVSSLERAMPSLVLRGVRQIDYFPIGLGINEFLIVEYYANDYDLPFVPSYLDDVSEVSRIRSFIQREINKEYVVDSEYIDPFKKRWVVYRMRSMQDADSNNNMSGL